MNNLSSSVLPGKYWARRSGVSECGQRTLTVFVWLSIFILILVGTTWIILQQRCFKSWRKLHAVLTEFKRGPNCISSVWTIFYVREDTVRERNGETLLLPMYLFIMGTPNNRESILSLCPSRITSSPTHVAYFSYVYIHTCSTEHI